MADWEDTAAAEAAEASVSGAGLGAALAMEITRRKGAAKAKREDDPGLDVFLAEHTRLARLQVENLEEQGDLTLSRLRWARFSDRMRALLQMMTALAGTAVVALIGAMVWQAHGQHGLEIEAFSVPPDLARGGLTGQVAASRFLDKLHDLAPLGIRAMAIAPGTFLTFAYSSRMTDEQARPTGVRWCPIPSAWVTRTSTRSWRRTSSRTTS
ncbi:MAG TPA: hypothetical protein VFE18_09635 [Phenylobacterium sp.]|jgi:NAD(P)-dependent dehydrogenase (short-subunit alcohol dehydrogenase family)|uniref:hypothetical protein n=1 Tax=Phenylobacterium sp. TaxID=1871053 RepID=UPI002D38F8A0|nr:hypothetical protein [Phenylobacterium sp.]HZZ68423.1 hypothetical protein [Phenylobacterium sp.]